MNIAGLIYSLFKPAAPAGSVNLPVQVDVNGPNTCVSISAPLATAAAPGLAQGDGTSINTAAGVLSAVVTPAKVQQEAFTYSADTGAANAYAVTLSPAPTLVAGSEIVFKAANANTGASTVSVNGGAATPIKKNGVTALASGDIAAGQIVALVYDGTNWQIAATGGAGASISAIQQEAYVYAADTGAANAYAITLSPAPTIVAGSEIVFKAANANTGASTVSVNGTGYPLTKNGATALSGGEISANQVITAKYDGANFQIAQGATGATGPAGGAYVKVGEVTVGAATATITFSSIPGGYRNLKLYLTGNCSSGSPDTILLQFNGDTGTNYAYGYTAGGAASGSAHANNATFIFAGNVNNSSFTGSPGATEITIFDYASTTWYKNTFSIVSRFDNGSGGMALFNYVGSWANAAAAVISIKLTLNSGSNFTTGTVATLYATT